MLFGMDYLQFLESTPPELDLRIEGYNKAIEDRLYTVWLTGKLNSFAYHDPKNYPKFESILPEKVEPESQEPPPTTQQLRREILAMVP